MSLTLSKRAQEVKPSSTLAITARAKELKSQGIDIIGFGVGEPDFNTPDNINRAAITAINEGFTKYTAASGIIELKEAICDKLSGFNKISYKSNQIVISNGGKHSLSNIFQVLLNPGDEVIIPTPFWLSYPEIVKLSDGVPVFIKGEKTNQYKVTGKQIEEACTEKTKAFILNSPSNPTGILYTKEELEEIAEVIVRKNIYVISDEMYENLVYEDIEHVSIASFNQEIYNRTITCSGMAKSYAMTGWRIGYTASNAEIASLMSNIQSHQTSNPNSIAQKAALEALIGPQDTIESMRQEFNRRRNYMYERVSQMPYFDCIKPQGAFYVYIDCNKLFEKKYKGKVFNDTRQIAEVLLDEFKVAVIPCGDFGASDHIRLSYATSMEDIVKGMDRMEEFIKQLG